MIGYLTQSLYAQVFSYAVFVSVLFPPYKPFSGFSIFNFAPLNLYEVVYVNNQSISVAIIQSIRESLKIYYLPSITYGKSRTLMKLLSPNLLIERRQNGESNEVLGVLIRPKDVGPEEAQRVLAVLNAAREPQELVDTIEIPGRRDVGVSIARSILDRRKQLGEFRSLSEVADVPQIDQYDFPI